MCIRDSTYVALPITNPGVKDGYLDQSNGIPTGTNGIGITINCENPDRLLRFFDWMLQREVQDYLQWGEEGTCLLYTSETNDAICKIALACGFHDVSSFNRSFKKDIGCTPSEYRARNK